MDSIRPELERAFKTLPSFGEVGFRVVLHEGKLVRIEYSSSIMVKTDPVVESNKASERRAPFRR